MNRLSRTFFCWPMLCEAIKLETAMLRMVNLTFSEHIRLI